MDTTEIQVSDNRTIVKRVAKGERLILSGQCRITASESQTDGVGILVEDGGELVVRPGTEIFIEGPRGLVGIRLLGSARMVTESEEHDGSGTRCPPAYVMVSGGSSGIECPKYFDVTGFSIWATLESHGVRVKNEGQK